MHAISSLCCTALACAALSAQTIQPPFAGIYGFTDLGSVPGVPTNYGGVTFKANDPNTLLIGGSANGPAGSIYEIGVVRDGTGRITGFQGTATLFSTAPYIDGGLAYGPGGVLFFTGYPTNELGQIKAGSTSPDRVISLSPLGVASSVGALGFVPPGFPGAGELKLASYNASQFYGFTLAPDGSGTFDITLANGPVPVQGGPEGILYVPPGSALLPNNQFLLLAEYSSGAVGVYRVDTQGNPILASRAPFLTGLSGAEGATTDPITGDLVFSTFGGQNRVITVQGFGVCGDFQTYGTGIPGSAGTPQVNGGGCAGRGQIASAVVTGGVPGAPGLLAAGYTQLAVPVFNGQLLLDPFTTFFHTLDAQGQFTLTVALPIDPILSSLRVLFQSFYIDAGATFGVSATNGLRMTIR